MSAVQFRNGKVLFTATGVAMDPDCCCGGVPQECAECAGTPTTPNTEGTAAVCAGCASCTPYCIVLTISGHPTNRHNNTWLLTQDPDAACEWMLDSDTDKYVVKKGGSAAWKAEIYENDILAYTYSWGSTDDECSLSSNATISGVTVTVTPCGCCEYAFDPGEVQLDYTEHIGEEVELLTGTLIDWAATVDVDWIHITSATSGTGSATIVFDVDHDDESVTRVGHITVGCAVFTITQVWQLECIGEAYPSHIVAGNGWDSFVIDDCPAGTAAGPSYCFDVSNIPSFNGQLGYGGLPCSYRPFNPENLVTFGTPPDCVYGVGVRLRLMSLTPVTWRLDFLGYNNGSAELLWQGDKIGGDLSGFGTYDHNGGCNSSPSSFDVGPP